ncbi:Large ribosomal RNA subunit accumulation protein YceD [Dillenia turbinata]|uniref:Large ribosomal RNA subunit accumulation protein YceD n=1 Tax=Dillenia turbinata TaxID=194707 RepID=A0AAN8VA06_9MAGN
MLVSVASLAPLVSFPVHEPLSLQNLKFYKSFAPRIHLCTNFNCKVPCTTKIFFRNLPKHCRASPSFNFTTEPTKASSGWEFLQEEYGEEELEDEGSPWVGAVVYRRNPSVSHLEYCTTLERLGLGKLSTDISRSTASSMGLRVTSAVKDYPFGTPVQVSVDVTRKKQMLRLDGIIKTVITLGCNRCGEPAAECVFSNFSLLLMEEPIEEPEIIDMGIIFGDGKSRFSIRNSEEDEDDETSVDWDDRLYFPPEEKEVDISKHIRDMVHVEITINAICDPKCKGLCLKCGANLNISSCKCNDQRVMEKGVSPFDNLKKQMQ